MRNDKRFGFDVTGTYGVQNRHFIFQPAERDWHGFGLGKLARTQDNGAWESGTMFNPTP